MNGWRTGVLAAVMLGAGHAAAAGDRPPTCNGDPAMCRVVMAGERDLTAMMVSGDVGAIRRLFADDAIWSLGDGTRQSKSGAMASVRKARTATSRLLQLDVRQFGTVAIALWKESWRAPGGTRDEVSFGTDTWMRRGGRWQIIASQEAHVPTAGER